MQSEFNKSFDQSFQFSDVAVSAVSDEFKEYVDLSVQTYIKMAKMFVELSEKANNILKKIK